VAADKRKTFWTGTGQKRKWTRHPERHAQNLLHTFLKAKFGPRIEVFEELSAGAGRIDIYVMLEGGLRFVVELTLAGAPGYSSTYAFSGAEQLQHYMEQKKSALGYLLVFDARIRDWGKGETSSGKGKYTVRVFFADVRAQVKTSADDTAGGPATKKA